MRRLSLVLQVAHKAYGVRRAYSTSSKAFPTSFNVLFCGTDEFALTSLRKLVDHSHVCRSIQVVTPPDAPNRWKRASKIVDVSPVRAFAEQNGLRHHLVPQEGMQALRLPEPFHDSPTQDNLLITASFGHLIPSTILRHFLSTHALNVHPSLLPQMRGAAPIQWAIARQMHRTGVSIQTLGEKFDTGSILAQHTYDLSPESKPTYQALRAELQEVAAELLVDTLENFSERMANAWSQSEGRNGLVKSHAPKLRREHSFVRWETWDAKAIEARHRGSGYLFPLTTSFAPRHEAAERKQVQFHQVDVQCEISSEVDCRLREKGAGAAVYDPEQKALICKCFGDTSFLRISSLQTVGRNAIAAEEWIKGYGDPKQRYREYTFMTI